MKPYVYQYQDALVRAIRCRWLQHVGFWVVLLCLEVLPIAGRMPFQTRVVYASAYILSLVIVVYAHFWLWARFLARRRYWPYGGGLAATIAIVALAHSRFSTGYLGMWGSPVASALNFGFFVLFTSAIKLGKSGIRQKIEFQEIKAKHLQTELELLRAQINPHFLFNTLNNLYAMAQKEKDSSTADAIARLSHLMRYVIYDSAVGHIGLGREIEQIRGYIELQKLRFSEQDDIHVSFTVSGDVGDLVVAPMLLLPLVENAFKHGISLKQPSRVTIDVKVTERTMLFRAVNTVRMAATESVDGDSALGLKNVRRRLELLYPGAHELCVGEADGQFTASLRLTLR
jgi:sensor histidine kinase YesM